MPMLKSIKIDFLMSLTSSLKGGDKGEGTVGPPLPGN
jgi:hypothetical protein